MSIRLGRDRRSLPVILCIVTLVSVVVLLLWDVLPSLFPAKAHNLLGAIPLAMIACACLVYEAVRRPSRSELIKAILLACAFLFWAANQFWPDLPQATLFNDIAIALFVFDVFLAIIAGPVSTSDDPGAEEVKPELAKTTDQQRMAFRAVETGSVDGGLSLRMMAAAMSAPTPR
jgi:hypothetical protein